MSRGRLLRIFAVFVGCLVCFAIDGIGAGIAMWRMPNKGAIDSPLSDFGHTLLPYTESCKSDWVTWLLLAELVILAITILFHSQSVNVLILAGLAQAPLSLLRAMTVWITSFPNCDPLCVLCGRNNCPESLWESIVITMQSYPLNTCGDLMFSGHFMYFLLAALCFHSLWSRSKLIHIALVFVTTIGGLGLIQCRVHYSGDVLVSLGLTLGAWFYAETHWLTSVMNWINQEE